MKLTEGIKRRFPKAGDVLKHGPETPDVNFPWEDFRKKVFACLQSDQFETGNELRGFKAESATKLAVQYLILHPERRADINQLLRVEDLKTEVERALAIGVLDFPGRVLTLMPELRGRVTQPEGNPLDTIRLEAQPRESGWRTLAEQLVGFVILYPERRKEVESFKTELLENIQGKKQLNGLLIEAANICLLFPDLRPEIETKVKAHTKFNPEEMKKDISNSAHMRVIEGLVSLNDQGGLSIVTRQGKLSETTPLPERGQF